MESERAKAVVREYFQRLLNQRDLSVCEELLSPDYVDHDAPPDTPPGPQSIVEFVGGFLDDHPDLRFQIEDLIAEGNKVALRAAWHGTNRHSGEKYHRIGIVILRLNEAGQLAERWSAYKCLP